MSGAPGTQPERYRVRRIAAKLKYTSDMNPVVIYTKDFLAPRLRSHGLNKHQRAEVVADIEMRLTSVLSHWGDTAFRRTILMLGEEEGTFWEPSTASLNVRALVVLGVRNSVIENLHFTTRMRRQTIDDADIVHLTVEAIKVFDAGTLTALELPKGRDIFGSLPARFPNAWRALSLLANSDSNEIEYQLVKQVAEPIKALASGARMRGHSVVAGGLDLGLDSHLLAALAQVQQGEAGGLTVPSFARLTRNPVKLLSILDHLLRHGGTFTTDNYAFSSTLLARRQPLIRPPHNIDDVEVNGANSIGLSARHKELLG